jgi:predicted phage terminase large subunit-like protein
MNGDELLASMLRNPSKARCELSLLEFTKQAWEVLEPGVKFQHGYAVEALSEHLQAVTEGHIKRLLINVPPGCTKSMMTNVMWPSWEWGPRALEHHRFISASYEQGLAVRDMVRGRDLLKSEWFQARWPVAFKDDQDQKTYYENTRTGWRFAASVRAALTGYRGDRIVVDDPHSVKGAESDAEREESLRWFAETLPTRLNKQGESAIVVIMQRLHQRDIAGLIIDELGDEWTHLCLPMEYEADRHCRTTVVMPNGEPFSDWRREPGELLWPERFPRDSVEALKKQLRAWGGSYAEAAQLQQRPAPREGGMFKVAKFRIIDTPPANVVHWVRGWDLAATSKKKNPRAAWTAGAKLGMTPDGTILIADMRRIQGSPGEVKDLIRTTGEVDGKRVRISVPQDPGQAGVAQVADLAAGMQGYLLFGSPEAGDKAQRALPLSAQVEAGNVCLVRAPWNDAFLAEAALFPASTYKDQVDACSRAYAELLALGRPNTAPRVAPTLFPTS